jgi:hypothetical protein
VRRAKILDTTIAALASSRSGRPKPEQLGSTIFDELRASPSQVLPQRLECIQQHQVRRISMRRFKLVGLAMLAVIALSAVASTAAQAELPEFTPGAEGTKFTGTSGTGTLTAAGGTIVCKKDTTSGALTTGKNLATATVDFTECTAFGIFGAHSLEDSEGVILVKANLHLCYISKAKKEVGVLTEITSPVHVEVAGKLIVITGDQVGQITPVNTATTSYSIVYKNPAVQCEGKTEHLKAAENEGEAKEASEATTEAVTFGVSQTLTA